MGIAKKGQRTQPLSRSGVFLGKTQAEVQVASREMTCVTGPLLFTGIHAFLWSFVNVLN